MTEQQQSGDSVRLQQLLRLVAKENSHLEAVRGRLFGDQSSLTVAWVEALLVTPEGIDRLESFGAKFARMQDTIVDKLLPQLLKSAGERPGAAIDNLNRAERLGLIANANDWIAMRQLRNKMVHEYIESPAEIVPVLQQSRTFTAELHHAYKAIADYASRLKFV